MTFQSARVRDIQSSPAMAVSLEARRMRSAGADVIDLSLGEPDFDTPAHIIDAAFEHARAGFTHYTGPAGTEALREAIQNKFRRENALDVAEDEIAVGGGAKQILFNAFLATLETGDEVVVPAPYWVSYTDIIKLHGGVAKIVACGTNTRFKLTEQALEAAITKRTRWLLLNTPANPSGAVYSEQDLRALGAVLERHPHILVLSDEIYEQIVFGSTRFVSFASACPQLRDRMLIVNGVSKAYAMTGWRLGYATGPRELIAGINKLQSQGSTCASIVSQAAATAALDGPQHFVERARTAYNERNLFLRKAFDAIDGLDLEVPPEGAFYAFPNAGQLIGRVRPDGKRLETDSDLARYLLTEAGIATLPGAAFGLSPYLRLSCAADLSKLKTAMTRVSEAVAALRA